MYQIIKNSIIIFKTNEFKVVLKNAREMNGDFIVETNGDEVIKVHSLGDYDETQI